ncbi:hypothetical protein [Cupriavidus sp. USMAA2-4]|uniref:hypothetical protein n=1 Tax=Cupriavidus sp. USMAA2-4 TaxID=876364 RepID=UPI0012F4CC12|nr:hypothetical protein [Cupriavidus sp. USMAA2-4]
MDAKDMPPLLAAVLAEVERRSLDPDYRQHPELFIRRVIGDAEILAHRESRQVDSLKLPQPLPCCSALPESSGHRFVPWSIEERAIPESILKRAGWRRRRSRGKSPEPVTRIVPIEWVDLVSGEIFTTSELRAYVKHGDHKLPGTGSISERALRAAAKVGECTPSEREFVAAVLRLRNHRGGLVVDLNTLIARWIAWKHPGMLSNHIARKCKQLAAILDKRKIMANPQTLYRSLQFIGNTDPCAALTESAKVYGVVPVHGKMGVWVGGEAKYGPRKRLVYPTSNITPHWLAQRH